MERWRLSLVLMLAVGWLGGCRSAPQPTVPAPTADLSPFGAPELSISAEPVSFRQTELEAPTALDLTAAITLTAGSNVLVGEDGRARLAWGDILTADLYSDTDLLLSKSFPPSREIMIDQATGTGAYALRAVTPPIQVTIQTAWASLDLDDSGAQVLVSYITGAEPSLWIVALHGGARLTTSQEGVVELAEGQAIGLSESGALAEPLAVDVSAIQTWLDRFAAGDRSATIATVALRCRTLAVADLREKPDPEAASAVENVPGGTLVQVLGRTEAADWLHMLPLATTEDGWLPADAVRCNGPLFAAAPVRIPPTPTPVPARPTVTRPPVLAPPSVTPTATTTVSAVKIYFATTDDSIRAGTCSTLVWEVQGIREVYLDGQGVTGKGEREVCPSETRTYTLKIIHVDGRVEERSVEIEVRKAPTQTVPPPTDTPPPPTAEPTGVPSDTPPPP